MFFIYDAIYIAQMLAGSYSDAYVLYVVAILETPITVKCMNVKQEALLMSPYW